MAGQSTDFNVKLEDFQAGRRYRGQLQVGLTGEASCYTVKRDMDITFLACTRTGTKAPPVDISAWEALGRGDNSALHTSYDGSGLRIHIVIWDEKHAQSLLPANMWMEDSVQISFDMDAEQAWVENQGGFNGHKRVYEYGVALGVEKPMTWRWLSGDSRLAPDVAEDRVQAQVVRSDGRTEYDILFPWTVLGLSEAPKSGTYAGVAMVVNDAERPGGARKISCLFGGIADEKDPSLYGKLYFR